MENVISRRLLLKHSWKASEWLVFIINSLCIFLFIYTAYAKITDYTTFKHGLSRLAFLGSYSGYIAWLIPVSEIIIATLLLIPRTVKYGLIAFTSLMTLFTSYLIAVMLSNQELPCSCGGVIQSMSWPQHIWFNLAFIVLGTTAIFIIQSKKIF